MCSVFIAFKSTNPICSIFRNPICHFYINALSCIISKISFPAFNF